MLEELPSHSFTIATHEKLSTLLLTWQLSVHPQHIRVEDILSVSLNIILKVFLFFD